MKQFQRRTALDRRKALPKETIAQLSARICENILASEYYQDAGTILVYNAFGSEADLTNVIRQAKLDGKRICWPCCLTKTEMAAFIPDGEDAWKTGAFGIREPIVNRSARIPPEEIDLVLCPCAAFDSYGHRVGMGAGYYDRYLPQCNNAIRIITAFEIQRTALIYTEKTDSTANVLATEAGLFPAETEDNGK